MVVLNDVQIGSLFKMCGEKTLAEVGFEYGLDKDFKSVAAMKVKVSSYYNKVKNNPEDYGISMELVNSVVDKVDARFRSMTKNGTEEPLSLREKKEILNPTDIKGLVLGGRNKAAKLLYEKLDRIGNSKKMLDELDLGKLATVMAILVDKGQIIQGQSTENIAILSKNVDSTLTPQQALELVLRSREQNMETK
jgi:hypothetical protein